MLAYWRYRNCLQSRLGVNYKYQLSSGVEMDVVTPFLQKWMCDFLKSKDAFFKRIESLDCEGNEKVTVQYKDGRTLTCAICPSLTEQFLEELTPDHPISVVTLNDPANFQLLLAKWTTLTSVKNLTFYFVNPFSKLEKKWIIMPYTHHKICDESALESGLKSMFETVEPTDYQEAKKRLA